MEEILKENGGSLAAPLIFILVFFFHFVSKYVEFLRRKKTVPMNEADVQLRADINKLLKEADSMSQPSTFAEAAKLRRIAAAKEKELAKDRVMVSKEIKSSFDKCEQPLMILKVVLYSLLILWFWGIPVSTISVELVQPFGKLLSWRSGISLKDNVTVGIIPWLILSTRVCKFICRKILSD